MLNNDGIKSSTYSAPVQILANVEHQYSIGCRVPKSMGVTVNGRIIVKAGTPITVDFSNLQAVVTAASGGSGNAVLLHNVDVTGVVTGGSKNGTALIWGFVNVNRLDTDVQALVTPGTKVGDVQFLKV